MMVSASALSNESPREPTEVTAPASASRSVERIDRYWLPRSEWCTSPSSWACRRQLAISSASKARSVRSDREACQPTMNRENASMTKAT
jgi:hypothetical protein